MCSVRERRQAGAEAAGAAERGEKFFVFSLRVADPKKKGETILNPDIFHYHPLFKNQNFPPALAERIAAGRSKGLSYREIEEQLFREVTPSFAEEERERLRLLVEEVGRERGGGSNGNNNSAAAAKKKAASKKAPTKKGG